jgi:hypothetical protein
MRAVVLSIVLVCGCTSSTMLTPEAAGPIPAGSSAIAPNADPICGEGDKWNGQRCIADGTYDQSKLGGRLEIVDVVIGSGKEARPGDTAEVHYAGTLEDGTKFDSSRDRGQPYEVKIGAGQVIKGFERGIVGMKPGGIRRIVIPPELGYGRKGQPPVIPPNATLKFEIEVLSVK